MKNINLNNCIQLFQILGLLLLLFSSYPSKKLNAQILSILPETIEAKKGDTIALDINVANFNNIAFLASGIEWDSSILDFIEIDYLNNLPYLSSSSFNTNYKTNGILLFSWFDRRTIGVTLPDSNSIFTLVFKVIGQEGSSTEIDVGDKLFLKTEAGTLSDTIPLNLQKGFVSVIRDCSNDFSFNCPSDTLISCSIMPDSTGYPTVTNRCLLDTLYYSDVRPLTNIYCSDTTFTFFRDWVLRDTFGQVYSCRQMITILKDFSKIIIPTDTILNYCEHIDNLDHSNTGSPIYLGEKLSTQYYRFDLRIFHSDIILSKFQRRRYFKIADLCNPVAGVIDIGSQLITLATEIDSETNMTCQVEVNKGDTISFANNLPANANAYRYNYLGDCENISPDSPRFQDNELSNMNYSDDFSKKDTIEICAEGNVILMGFTEFDLKSGDTLFVYRGTLDALRKENTPDLLKASGTGVAQAYGGWIVSSDESIQNNSGCLTFIFETNGDGQTGSGWDTYWGCKDFTCPADIIVEESLLPASTGYPIFSKKDNLVDTLFYNDDEDNGVCINNNENILERTWTIQFNSGITKTCTQDLTFTKKDISDIKIPQDKLINKCSSWPELRDLTITGVPTIYNIPLAEDKYTYGLIVIVQDSIISNRQVKRKFAAYDWCRALGPIPVGDQLITFPSIGDADNDTVIDCMDLCDMGDDRINSDGLGMPDDCDCDPDNPNDEFIEVNQVQFLNEEQIDSTYHASFQISSNGSLRQGDSITFYAGHVIILKAGFFAPSGSSFIAEIDQDCSNKNNRLVKLNSSKTGTSNLNKQTYSNKVSTDLELAIFPNPIKEKMTISYFLSKKEDVKLTLYNSWGRAVRVLQNENLPKGNHQITFLNQNLVTGTYYITLQTAQEVSTKKLLVLETK